MPGLTSAPATFPNRASSTQTLEIPDVTFALNLGWAESREERARLIIYQSLHDFPIEPIYQPTPDAHRILARIEAGVTLHGLCKSEHHQGTTWHPDGNRGQNDRSGRNRIFLAAIAARL